MEAYNVIISSIKQIKTTSNTERLQEGLVAIYRHHPSTQPHRRFRLPSFLIANSKAITDVPISSQSPPDHPLNSLFPNHQPPVSLLSADQLTLQRQMA